MTSNSEILGNHLPSGNQGLPLPPSRAESQNLQGFPRSWPRQTATLETFVSTFRNDLSVNTSEPASKKQKLEGGTETRSNHSVNRENPSIIPDHTASDGDSPRLDCLAKDPPEYQAQLLPIQPVISSVPITHQQEQALAIDRASRKDTVPVKAYVAEPPSCASRLHVDGPADFFPWSGNHIEDILNESTTKQGYYDKIQPSQNESSTARPPIWASVKQKSGLQILSSLFVSALDQRQKLGVTSINSTFKPPPRVTLTDTKREAWLRDLAEPSIPIRRLSRTIPHGVRGKSLLDHCLSKNIPIPRAIWLAKCVGANEIRAFKRKGTGGAFTVGGEDKWIKDWTINIEQFLETLIGQCGTPDWKKRIEYGLQLVFHLFDGRLLDKNHYLEWIIACIENSNIDGLAIWLLIEKKHHQDLIKQRKRGRRVASAILNHLHANDLLVEKEVHATVLQQLREIFKSLLITSPACLLLPDDWSRYRRIVEDSLIHGDSDPSWPYLEDISRRNVDLQDRHTQANMKLSQPWRRHAISLMDTLASKPKYGEVAGACFRLAGDHDLLVETCIEWSCSVNRYGLFRTFAATRLLRIWSRKGFEIQEPFLHFLAARSNSAQIDKGALCRLCAELIQSRHLSVSKFLQWLMARGLQNGRHKHGWDCPCDIRLLLELPLHGLPLHVLSLRQTMLLSIHGIDAKNEADAITAAKSKYKYQVPSLLASDDPSPGPQAGAKDGVGFSPATLGQSASSAIAQWLRQSITQKFQIRTADKLQRKKFDDRSEGLSDQPLSIINMQSFESFRRILVDLREFRTLADIMSLVIDHAGSTLLTAITNTVNYYFNIFYAIGAADNLFQKLYHRMKTEPDVCKENAFVESLTDLCGRVPGTRKQLTDIRRATVMHASKQSTAAYSPISDTMLEVVPSTEPDFMDEMDQLLASGTSMDRQTMKRIFGTIVSHLEKSLNPLGNQRLRYAQLLASLRTFDSVIFDLLWNEWLQQWLRDSSDRKLSAVLLPMVSYGVISLEAALSATVQIIFHRDDTYRKADLVLDTIDLLIDASSETMTGVDFPEHIVQIQLQQSLQQSPNGIAAVLRALSEVSILDEPSIRKRAEKNMNCESVRHLVQSIVLHQIGKHKSEGTLDKDLGFSADTASVIGAILFYGNPVHNSDASPIDKTISVFINVTDFNLFFSRLEIKAIWASNSVASKEHRDVLSAFIVEEAGMSAADRIELWQHLISELCPDLTISIEVKAETRVLTLLNEATETLSGIRMTSIANLSLIIQACTPSASLLETLPFLEKVGDMLGSIVSSNLPIRRTQHNDFNRCNGIIHTLLRLLVNHQTSLQHPRYPQQHLCFLLVTLSLLLVHSEMVAFPTLARFCFDVLCLLTDGLCCESRSSCMRDLCDQYRIRDRRIYYLFGQPDLDKNEWLQLTTKSAQGSDGRLDGAAMHNSPKFYSLRPFEMMQDATPVAAENDTSLNLTLFGTKRSIL